ncbi:hypothetical protein JL721_3522 [Aureococcus anophagefferens]|nr:hypothetical protein JL721_3522 [Aureococcus anophagefferens]
MAAAATENRAQRFDQLDFIKSLIEDGEANRFDTIRAAVEDVVGGYYRGVIPMAGVRGGPPAVAADAREDASQSSSRLPHRGRAAGLGRRPPMVSICAVSRREIRMAATKEAKKRGVLDASEDLGYSTAGDEVARAGRRRRRCPRPPPPPRA